MSKFSDKSCDDLCATGQIRADGASNEVRVQENPATFQEEDGARRALKILLIEEILKTGKQR